MTLLAGAAYLLPAGIWLLAAACLPARARLSLSLASLIAAAGAGVLAFGSLLVASTASLAMRALPLSISAALIVVALAGPDRGWSRVALAVCAGGIGVPLALLMGNGLLAELGQSLHLGVGAWDATGAATAALIGACAIFPGLARARRTTEALASAKSAALAAVSLVAGMSGLVALILAAFPRDPPLVLIVVPAAAIGMGAAVAGIYAWLVSGRMNVLVAAQGGWAALWLVSAVGPDIPLAIALLCGVLAAACVTLGRHVVLNRLRAEDPRGALWLAGIPAAAGWLVTGLWSKGQFTPLPAAAGSTAVRIAGWLTLGDHGQLAAQFVAMTAVALIGGVIGMLIQIGLPNAGAATADLQEPDDLSAQALQQTAAMNGLVEITEPTIRGDSQPGWVSPPIAFEAARDIETAGDWPDANGQAQTLSTSPVSRADEGILFAQAVNEVVDPVHVEFTPATLGEVGAPPIEATVTAGGDADVLPDDLTDTILLDAPAEDNEIVAGDMVDLADLEDAEQPQAATDLPYPADPAEPIDPVQDLLRRIRGNTPKSQGAPAGPASRVAYPSALRRRNIVLPFAEPVSKAPAPPPTKKPDRGHTKTV